MTRKFQHEVEVIPPTYAHCLDISTMEECRFLVGPFGECALFGELDGYEEHPEAKIYRRHGDCLALSNDGKGEA